MGNLVCFLYIPVCNDFQLVKFVNQLPEAAN